LANHNSSDGQGYTDKHNQHDPPLPEGATGKQLRIWEEGRASGRERERERVNEELICRLLVFSSGRPDRSEHVWLEQGGGNGPGAGEAGSEHTHTHTYTHTHTSPHTTP